MTKIILNAYTAERDGGFLSINLGLGGDPPFPRKIVEVHKLAGCIAAFDAYKEEARLSGLPLAVSMMLARGERAPPGFKKLKSVSNFETVNIPA